MEWPRCFRRFIELQQHPHRHEAVVDAEDDSPSCSLLHSLPSVLLAEILSSVPLRDLARAGCCDSLLHEIVVDVVRDQLGFTLGTTVTSLRLARDKQENVVSLTTSGGHWYLQGRLVRRLYSLREVGSDADVSPKASRV